MSLSLISYDPVGQGGAYLAALAAVGVVATLTPAGLMVSDAAAAATVAADAAAILMQAQAIRQAEVDGLRDQKIAAGWTYQGKVIEIDAGSQANIAAQALAALNSTVAPTTYPWNANTYWICADNSHLALGTAAEMLALGSAAGAYVSGLILNAASLKAEIGAATTLAAVQAIDIASGWPT